MKKLLIATILSTTIISASATELPVIDSYGIYFQGDIGASNIKFTDEDFPKLPKQKISTQRISLGYYYNNSRFSLDYTNIEQIKWKYLLGNLDLKVKSFGFSIFRDFEFSSNLVPYLGFRLSLNKANMLHSYFNIPFVETETSSVGYGALAGLQVKINENFSINLGAEYNVLFKDLHQYGGNVGIRFNF